MFFPGELNQKLRAEIRNLPRMKSREASLEIYVKEILLGPVRIDDARLLPKDTKIETIMLREKSL
ncbi:MAG: hypothetical protein AB1798_10475, partial [Spirochaetota bacterium]